jgi:hypothetical protein
LAQQFTQGDGAKAHAALAEKPAARYELLIEAAIEMGLAIHRQLLFRDRLVQV